MGLAALATMLFVILVGLLRRGALGAGGKARLPEDLLSMPKRFSRLIWMGVAVIGLLEAFRRFVAPELLARAAYSETDLLSLAIVIGFRFMGIANMFDALRLRQLLISKGQ